MLTLASELKPGQKFMQAIKNPTTVYTVSDVSIVENGRFPVKVSFSSSVLNIGKKQLFGGGALYFRPTDFVNVI